MAQRRVELTPHGEFPKFVLAQALNANGFTASAVKMVEGILERLKGRSEGPFSPEMAEELLATLNKRASKEDD